MKKVSIIVPVYNAEAYLDECVGSLLAQTYENVEILLVENNSTDCSFEKCQVLEQAHTNIRAFSLETSSGPSTARNFGVANATGDYLGFCDSDDYVKPEMIADLVTYLENSESDYVISDMYAERIASDLGLPWEDNTVFVGEQIKNEMLPLFIGNESDNDTAIPVWGSVVKCLFKTEIIRSNHITFPEELNFAEDLVFTLRYLVCCERAVVRNKSYYHYRFNDNSLMNSYRAYKANMKEKHFLLMEQLRCILESAKIFESVQMRYYTTARAYIKECVGNACKKAPGRSFGKARKEVKEILSEPITQSAFAHFDAADKKNKWIYTLIRQKRSVLLTGYYYFRARM